MKKILLCAAVIALAGCSGNDSVMVTDSSAETEETGTNGDTDEEQGVGEDNSSDDGGSPDDSNSPDDGDAPDDGNTTAESSATYRLTFNATWSADTHPLDFPSNPHFSGLVGAVHNEQVQFWARGQLATDGIELMAETGDKTILLAEVDSAIASGYASSAISGGGVATSPGPVSVEFEVSRDYPEITVVSMVAPSPDWFVGVRNYSLLENGSFVSSRTVDLAVYDSGTDSGTRYTSGDIDTDSPEPIGLLTSQPEDSPFQDGLPHVGQFVIERL